MPGLLDRNPIGQDYADHITKHLSVLRSYGLHKAAQYLEEWVSGTTSQEPLLDVSAPLDISSMNKHVYKRSFANSSGMECCCH